MLYVIKRTVSYFSAESECPLASISCTDVNDVHFRRNVTRFDPTFLTKAGKQWLPRLY